MSAACPKCGHVHVAGDVIAVRRFGGTTAYRTDDMAEHISREVAQEWLCRKRRWPA